jgi:hypothetical protein
MDPRWMRETPVDPIIEIEEAQAEARRALRRAISLPCELMSHYWASPVPHTMSDVSPFGMWIDTFFPLHAGAELVVSFMPPGLSRELVLFGEVVRAVTTPGASLGMGIGFVRTTAADEDALDALLRGVPPRLVRPAPIARARTLDAFRGCAS